jgi:hypothetical protein
MPLGKLVNTGGEFFELDVKGRFFNIHKKYQGYWQSPEFQSLVQDRIDFALARYFYRKGRGAVEVPYAIRRDQGFTAQMRSVIAGDPSGIEWHCILGGKGYSGNMDIEVKGGEHFTARTTTRYDDISRFPTRIKAAATALFEEGLHGEFHVVADKDSLKILRKPAVKK